MQRYVTDLGRAWPVLLLFGGLVPLLFSVSWLILVCYFIEPTVWITLLLLNILALLVTLLFYVKGMGSISNGVQGLLLSRPECFQVLPPTLETKLVEGVSLFTADHPFFLSVSSVGWIGHDPVTAVIGSNASDSLIWASSSVSHILQ